jgi:hypothetical protein
MSVCGTERSQRNARDLVILPHSLVRLSDKLEKRIQHELRAGKGILKVAHEVGVGHGTVQRIAQEMGRPFDAAAAA